MAASPRKPKKPGPASDVKRSADRAARARALRAKERVADKMLRDLRQRVAALNISADKLLARLS